MGYSEKAFSRVAEEKAVVEKIEGLIPGYHGYQDREKIRETDRLVRDELTRILKMGVGNLNSCYSVLVTNSNPLSTDVDRVKLKADRISEAVRHAEYGYAGFYDPVKIQADELHALLTFDGGLVNTVQEITTSSENLLKQSREGKDIKETLAKLESSLEGFDNEFGQRKQFMQGLKG